MTPTEAPLLGPVRAEARFEMLKALGLVNMPSRLLVRRDASIGAFFALVGVAALIFDGVTGVALPATLVGVVTIARSISRTRALRTGDFSHSLMLRLFDCRPPDDALLGVSLASTAVVRSFADVMDTLNEVETAVSESGLLNGLRTRLTAKLPGMVQPSLDPDERILVILYGLLSPPGLRRVAMWLSLWIIDRPRSVVITATNRRLIIHKRTFLGRRATFMFADDLADLVLLEWRRGVWHTDRLQVNLVLRRPGGRKYRLDVHRLLSERARRLFEVIASASEHPPIVLTRYWELTAARRLDAVRQGDAVSQNPATNATVDQGRGPSPEGAGEPG